MSIRYSSVCDGIGAAHVAWQPLGWQCQWTSEIEPFPAAVVEQHHGFANIGDMTKITEEMLNERGPVDLLVGGTPCQSFSVAGLRGGLADPRGNLALRFVQLAAVMQPRWIVWENVPGVLSSGKGRDFGTFLRALGELGYGFAYRVLDAQWFGVAQRRRRVFVVGYLGDWRRAAAVLFERESVFGNPPTRGAKGQGTASRAQDGPDTCGTLCADRHPGGYSGQDAYTGRLIPEPVSFKGNMSTPSWCVGQAETLQAANGCAVAYDVHGTLAKKGATPTDVHTALRSRRPGESEASTTTVVAFAQNQREEVRDLGDCATALNLQGTHQQTFLATPYTKSKRAQSVTDDESWVPGEVSPTMSCFDQGDTRATTVVTTPIDLRQASRGEKVTNNRSHGSGGPPGHGVGDGGDHAFTVSERGQAVAFKISHYTRGKDGAPSEVAAPLSADADKGDQDTVVAQGFTYSGYGNQPAWMTGDRTDCLPASGHSDGSHQGVGVATPMTVRRLTPRECERLQGFPDDYTLVTYRGKPAADGPRYRALGNSMAVPVMRWIGERIAAVDSLPLGS